MTGWPSTGEAVPLAEAIRAIGIWLTYGPTAQAATLAIPVLLLVFGLLDADRRPDGRWRALVPVLWVAVPVAAFLAAGLFREANLKFLIACQIGLALWLARGLWVLWTLQASGRRGGSADRLRMAARVAAAGALAWMLAIMVLNLPALATDPALQRADYRAMAAAIRRVNSRATPSFSTRQTRTRCFSTTIRGAPRFICCRRGWAANDAETRAAVEAILKSHARTFTVFWGEAERDPNRVVETMLGAGAFEGAEQWYGDVRLAVHVMPAPLTEECAGWCALRRGYHADRLRAEYDLRSPPAMRCRYSSHGRPMRRWKRATRCSSSCWTRTANSSPSATANQAGTGADDDVDARPARAGPACALPAGRPAVG